MRVAEVHLHTTLLELDTNKLPASVFTDVSEQRRSFVRAIRALTLQRVDSLCPRRGHRTWDEKTRNNCSLQRKGGSAAVFCPQSPSRETPGRVSPVGTPSAGPNWRPRLFLQLSAITLPSSVGRSQVQMSWRERRPARSVPGSGKHLDRPSRRLQETDEDQSGSSWKSEAWLLHAVCYLHCWSFWAH